MKREFWAEFDLYGNLQKSDGQANKQLLDGWVEREGETATPWNQLRDAAARQSLLAQATVSTAKVEFQDKQRRIRSAKVREYARTGALQYEEKGGLFYWYYGEKFPNPGGSFQDFLREQLQRCAKVLGYQTQEIQYSNDAEARSGILTAPVLPDLSRFPPGTWAVQVTFTLRKPYISKDDVDFYILDNPVKKEHVFKVPYVAPSQWKGALRAAMRRLRGYTTWEQEAEDEQMVRLFGNVKGEEEDFSAGRLHFYPTFFDRIGLEVINPHDRKTGAGKHPIYFECVPAGARGVFTLLYVPLDLSDKPETAQQQAKEDLQFVAQGIRAMLTKYGFGAKTSSGYGVAEIENFHTETQRTQG